MHMLMHKNNKRIFHPERELLGRSEFLHIEAKKGVHGWEYAGPYQGSDVGDDEVMGVREQEKKLEDMTKAELIEHIEGPLETILTADQKQQKKDVLFRLAEELSRFSKEE